MKIIRPLSILAIAAAASACAAPGADAGKGCASLFDGESLANWSGDPKFWSVEDGAITGQTTADNPTKGNTFLDWVVGLEIPEGGVPSATPDQQEIESNQDYPKPK